MDFDKYTTEVLTMALSNKFTHEDKHKVIKDMLETIYDKGYDNGKYDEYRQQLEDDYGI